MRSFVACLLLAGCSAPIEPIDAGRDATHDVQRDAQETTFVIPPDTQDIVDIQSTDITDTADTADVVSEVTPDTNDLDSCAGAYCRVCHQEGSGLVCGPECVDTSSNVDHCGMCDYACNTIGIHQHSICASGACQLVCDTGFADCDSDPRNGCETDISDRQLFGSSVLNCGACGRHCGVNASRVSTCINQLCVCSPEATCGSWGTCQGNRCVPN